MKANKKTELFRSQKFENDEFKSFLLSSSINTLKNQKFATNVPYFAGLYSTLKGSVRPFKLVCSWGCDRRKGKIAPFH
ncbi:hypothetical protein D3833_04580 [Streptococcus mutans]|nr:hypothetical protein [Streptococcus mutans]NLQ39913.1 hypothetical protein [Streptococcus mutans]NLQ63008.1 hypothetical protein [Streptococcus mutans]